MDLASIQQAVIATSAVVATLTFIYKVFDDKRSREARDLFDRQMALEHQASRETHAERDSREGQLDALRTGGPNAAAKTVADGLLAATAGRKISVSIAAERITDHKTASRFPLLSFKRSNGFVLRNDDPVPAAPDTVTAAAEPSLSHDERMRHAASHETLDLLQRIADLRAKPEGQKS